MEKDLVASYIEQLADGTHCSTGSFTVNLAARAQALARLVELEPCIYLGRFLQAATVGNAHGIAFKVTRAGTEIRLRPSDTTPFESLAFLWDGQPKDEVQRYLELGLLSARALHPQRLAWSFRGESGGYRVDLLSPDLKAEPLAPGAPEACLELSCKPVGWLSSLKVLLRGRFRELEFLLKRCSCSTVPCSIDGRLASIRGLFSTPGAWLSIFFLGYSTRLAGPDQHPRDTFNGLGPGCRIALNAKVQGHELPRFTAPEDVVKLAGENGDSFTSLARVEGAVEISVEVWKGGPDRPGAVALHRVVHPRAPHSEDERTETLRTLYVDAPEARLPWTVKSEWTDVLQSGLGFRCERFLAITKNLRTFPPKPIRTALVLIKDGMVVETEPPADWEEGWIAVTAIPDCTMDGDAWRVVKNEAYVRMVADLKRDLVSLVREEAACRHGAKPL